MNARSHTLVFLLLLAQAGNAYGLPRWLHGKSKKNGKQPSLATVVVDSGLPGCKVDLDGVPSGVTSSTGTVSVEGVDPGDHYLHVQCPEQSDTPYFISPTAGQKLQVNAHSAAKTSRVREGSPLAEAVAAKHLRRMVSQAVQLRANGRFEESVELFRKATQLDPRNGDLHRELGITFLMFHDWERARVEMLEAVRREPDNVEAHGGLAFALEKLADYDEALKQYRICTKLDPHDTSYRDHYVEVLSLMYSSKSRKKH